jgi:hypothetical protein
MKSAAKLMFLCGKMAAGKSTLARDLAEREEAPGWGLHTLVPARPHRMARLDDGDGLTRLRGRYRGGGVRASRGRARTPARRLRH